MMSKDCACQSGVCLCTGSYPLRNLRKQIVVILYVPPCKRLYSQYNTKTNNTTRTLSKAQHTKIKCFIWVGFSLNCVCSMVVMRLFGISNANSLSHKLEPSITNMLPWCLPSCLPFGSVHVHVCVLSYV